MALPDLDRSFCASRFFYVDGWITVGDVTGEKNGWLLTRDAAFYSNEISAPLKCEVYQFKTWVPDFKMAYPEGVALSEDYVLKADKEYLKRLSLMRTVKLSRHVTRKDQWMEVEAWGLGGASWLFRLKARVRVLKQQFNRTKMLITVQLPDQRWVSLWGWMRRNVCIGRFRLMEEGLQPRDYYSKLGVDDITLSLRTGLLFKSLRERRSKRKSGFCSFTCREI